MISEIERNAGLHIKCLKWGKMWRNLTENMWKRFSSVAHDYFTAALSVLPA
jgi:hypothetical protein